MFPWERFIFALCHVYDTRDNTLIFDEFFILMGRGNGKNGNRWTFLCIFRRNNHKKYKNK